MTLYLVPTPIGNLADMTFRAVEVLKEVDVILCEDTRHSLPLLQHYQIAKPLVSLHKFNELERGQWVVGELGKGKRLALITDAGMPAVSDPGQKLVYLVRQAGHEVVALPGANALLCALAASGLPSDKFQMCGFLPKKDGELRQFLVDALHYEGTTVFYEAPGRLIATLTLLDVLAPGRTVAVARELTKKFEEVITGTAGELLAHWDQRLPKGEIVLIIQGDSDQVARWRSLSLQEHLALLESFGVSQKEAVKLAANLRGIPKQEVYKVVHGSD